ncbi:MAG: hypothetical protein K6E38_02830 [Fretibacterium sp.]|nr:hypothetical protein [Fretibacterium sp.]
MLYIRKSPPSKEAADNISRVKTERKYLLDRQDPQAARRAFDSLDKSKIRKSLIREQHGLCGYCMRRIGDAGSTTIEHRAPVDKNLDRVLDYENMIGVCDGGRTADKEDWPEGRHILCCDASKGDREITIDPYDKNHMDKIRYSEKGRIYTYPEDKVLERDINDVLHLNGLDGLDTSTGLLRARREAYRSYVRGMRRQGGKVSRAYIEGRIKAIESQEIYPAFAGVILFFLKRKLRELTQKEERQAYKSKIEFEEQLREKIRGEEIPPSPCGEAEGV